MKSVIKPQVLTSLCTNIRRISSAAFSSDIVVKVTSILMTRGILILVSILSSVLISRSLLPEGRGIFAVVTTVSALGVQFGNLGLHASNTYYVARDKNLLSPLIGNSLVIGMAIGAVISLTLWLCFRIFPAILPVKLDQPIILGLISIPIGLTLLLSENLLIGLQKIGSYNFIEITMKVLVVIFFGVFILFREISVSTFVLSWLTATSIGLILSIFMLIKQIDIRPFFSSKLFKQGLYYGSKAYFSALFSFLVIRVDLLMVKKVLGDASAGYYSTALSMFDMVYILPAVIGTVLFPKLVASPDKKSKIAFRDIVVKRTFIIMLIVAPLAAWLAKPVIIFLYGNEFIPSVPVFVWLMPAVILLAVNTIFMNYFASIGMPSIVIYSPAIALIVKIILNSELLIRYGIIAVSWSSSAAFCIMLLLSIRYVNKERIDGYV